MIIRPEIGEDVTIHHPDLVNIYGCEISRGCKIGTFVEIQKNVTTVPKFHFLCKHPQYSLAHSHTHIYIYMLLLYHVYVLICICTHVFIDLFCHLGGNLIVSDIVF